MSAVKATSTCVTQTMGQIFHYQDCSGIADMADIEDITSRTYCRLWAGVGLGNACSLCKREDPPHWRVFSLTRLSPVNCEG